MIEQIGTVLEKYRESDSKILDIITNSLKYLYSVDKEHFYEYCQALCNLKDKKPNFTIKYDEKAENSVFDSYENCVIFNKKGLNAPTFFHEITHALHFYTSNAYCPEDLFSHIIQDESNYIFIINYINELRNNIFDISEKIDLNGNQYDKHLDRTIIKLNILIQAEGIIDSITKGTSYETGLRYVKDNFSLLESSKKGSGHGTKYFEQNNSFIEILAEYAAIRNSEFSKEIFKLLSLVIDIDYLEKCYKALCFNGYKIQLNQNNNNNKKI